MGRPRLDSPNYHLLQRGHFFYVTWSEGGEKRRVSTGTGERRAAERWLAQFIAGRENPAPPAQPTITEILAAYARDRRPSVASPATMDHCVASLVRHMGDLQPDHMTRERSRFYAAARRREGYEVGPAGAKRTKAVANGTIARELVILRAALRWAIAERWIENAPSVELPRQGEPRERWLTRVEAERLIEAAQAPHVRLFLLLALHTAARAGAILDLRWEQVDLDQAHIRFGRGTGNKGRSVLIPINDVLLPALLEAAEARTCEYVVEYRSERVGSVKHGTEAAARRAQLPGVTPHVLRHTAATWMVTAGVPIEVVAIFLGHTNPAVTFRVYAKYVPGYLRGAAAALAGGSVTGPVAHKPTFRLVKKEA
jgi:integrase